ncbi:phospholipase C, phosphocholine-specific [Sphingomonas oligophenolica]|uniref:phospholipase C n=1 Tax=Sphingomonas oligophenolica TaxID=301154 RepID=A0ABU9YC56_9SPHN
MRDRRDFLKMVASMTAAGTLPVSIGKALALPANRRTGSIADVEHVVILMQENRAFDHYFGTLRGVRGYGDPRPMTLRNGRSSFHQPAADGVGTVLPFHMDSRTTSGQLIKSLDHSWKGDAAEWADYDVWIKHKTPLSMGHFRREDIPFYHALADAFTIGDGYYASLHGPTNPNRMFLFSGTSGLSVGDDGKQAVENADDGNWTGDMARDKPDFVAAAWTTYPERLQKAGISWRLYQEYDNFGDNSLAYFKSFRGLAPMSDLYRRGRAIVPGSTAANAPQTDASPLVAAFAADVAAGTLPQVSWIVAPAKFSEHPEATPAFGESLTARLIEALVANPEVWAKTALIINYDENDGFFDHMPAPIPAIDRKMGLSTVDVRGESYQGQSVGLGVRVPLLVVSPWSRGGWVDSQVFDHTSVIRFLERRFGVMEPNISPWRRAVTGDLTSMFDFADPDASALRGFPETADCGARMLAQSKLPAPEAPAVGALPRQEPGQRPARPLPYQLAVHAVAGPGLTLSFVNAGAAGAVFNVYAIGGAAGPWFYTVGAGKTLSDSLPGLPIGERHEVRVHGPNGFLRSFAGDTDLGVEAIVETVGEAVLITLANHGSQARSLACRSLAYAALPQRAVELSPGATATMRYPVTRNDHWYDFVVEIPGSTWSRRFAGHVETGRPSKSDPAIGAQVIA